MTAIVLLILGILALFVWLLSRKDKEYKAQIEQERNDLLRRFSLEFVKLGADRSADKDSPSGTSFTKSDEAFMQQAMDVAKENIGNPDFSIDHFAAKMLMSRSNLNLRVRAKFGVSPLEFLKTVRFNEACRLLLERKQSISEIAYATGFATPSYFAATFRHVIGCTPTEYIKRNTPA
jgi:AraC-like DNA-binding protein